MHFYKTNVFHIITLSLVIPIITKNRGLDSLARLPWKTLWITCLMVLKAVIICYMKFYSDFYVANLYFIFVF